MRMCLTALRVVVVVFLTFIVVSPARADEGPPAEVPQPARIEVPEPTPQAVAYHHSGNIVWAAGQVWTCAFPWLVLLSGTSARLRDATARLGRRRLPAALLFFTAYALLAALWRLPLAYYAGFVRPREFGLSHQGFDSWALDEVKRFVFLLLIGLPSALVAYALLSRFPRIWWLWCGALAAPAALALALLKPVWFDPMFNEFRPMRDPALESRILRLAARAGIEADRVWQVDMSRKTKAVNAYVTGLLGTKRIVLWDTLLDRLGPDEVLAVMGHEMGHYALNHVLEGVLFGAVLSMLGLGLVHAAASWLLPRLPRRAGVPRMADLVSLPLLIGLGQVANLALLPAAHAYSRHAESEADRFSLELTRDNAAAARAFLALQRENLGYPRPGWFYTLWRGSHPSLGDRIDFCNDYRPWEEGRPLRYAERFRE